GQGRRAATLTLRGTLLRGACLTMMLPPFFGPSSASFIPALKMQGETMKIITLLLLVLALAVGAVAQDETKKSDDKKSEKKAAASNDKLQADLVAKEKALWDAWGKKDGKPFEESMSPDTVGVDAVNGISIGRDTAVKQVTTHNCEVQSYNLSDEKTTPIDKEAVTLTYKADADLTRGGQNMPAT